MGMPSICVRFSLQDEVNIDVRDVAPFVLLLVAFVVPVEMGAR